MADPNAPSNPDAVLSPSPSKDQDLPRRPSRLYHAAIWRACTLIARILPLPASHLAAHTIASIFWQTDPRRRTVVLHNLLPLCDGDITRATRLARSLYDRFAQKLIHLWRYEAGCNLDPLVGALVGESLFHDAVRQQKGVLLVTPHLGNWELGAPLMARHGIRLLAVTLSEPHAPLTTVRSSARARRGVETLVIQQDPFAFLEIIRRLERGEIVALLIDRPPAAVSLPIRFCGHPLDVSAAPAEIARASGCVVLPVFVLQADHGRYDAHVLPPIAYDRPSLRTAESRRQLCERTMSVFEPIIRAHPDQWFHFVPVWKATPSATP